MDLASLSSPSSDDRLWKSLRNRVETILEDRRLDAPAAAPGVESERGKRLREDSQLLLRGLDSVASSLALLSDTLTAAQKGVNALSTCSQTRVPGRSDDEEREAKRQCSSTVATEQQETPGAAKNAVLTSDGPVENEEVVAAGSCQDGGEKPTPVEVAKSTNLKNARNLAVSMAGRAAVLARELKNIKSELQFMQARCSILEEENRRLREGCDAKGVEPEEDDLVRLQLEALLAEKSRLAQENANLARENQSLIQLVEYHQLTSQDLSASYEEVIQGMCLDFSSPLGKIDSGEEGETRCDGEGAVVAATKN